MCAFHVNGTVQSQEREDVQNVEHHLPTFIYREFLSNNEPYCTGEKRWKKL